MGTTSSFIESEKLTWLDHSIKYDSSVRQENIINLDYIRNGVEIYMAFTYNSWGGKKFQHWFVTDGTYFIEFGSTLCNIYDARVTINTRARDFEKSESKSKLMNEEIRERICHVLGMCNYSLALRNCEHVANYIFRNRWTSAQMDKTSGLFFNTFKEKLLGEHKKLVNTFPSSIRPHVFKECEKRIIYSFLTDHLKATRFDYYLDSAENTYNILVVGPSGAGKSHLINVLFNQSICNADVSLRSVTREIYFVRGRGQVYDTQSKRLETKDVIVADTVGLCDTEWKDFEVINMIKNRISANYKYIDVVFIVFRADRLIKQYVDNIKKILGWLDCYKKKNIRLFFVATFADFLPQEKQADLSKEFKEIFSIKSNTARPFFGDENNKFESLMFTGFPPENELHPKTKERVIKSLERLTQIRKLPVAGEKVKIPISCTIL